MQVQSQGQASEEQGALYLVPTPIGNLEDMTFRAVRILQEVSVIYAEDTRQTRKLCNAYEIATRLDSFHEHNKLQKLPSIMEQLSQGSTVALVSDAGTPLVSDPGIELVRACIEKRVPVVPLPGANAAITSYIASGLGSGSYYFYGFLPRKQKAFETEIEHLSMITVPLVFYEAPHRLKQTLKQMVKSWPERQAVLAKELTKRYETYVRGTLSELLGWAESQEEVKGEYCLIVDGISEEEKEEAEGEKWWDSLTYKAHVESYIAEGRSPKEAMREAAKDRDVPKRDMYQAYHNL
ncbi:16S rRNA (cytidine(1402)-2'-O)-methyltransferase [Salsuginibacillus kocurii]|uniref:16S rRNA (cytidine(1402)-2'-O)-methyltransferase n=1 Tax=Salsuginibacillus kocurii TaxID=427078 RepID=UPI00036B94D4|nr:16S rRNA (cytidine(1402)-2'-O)-methyltransferase [Salsuginibacillus kocurii]